MYYLIAERKYGGSVRKVTSGKPEFKAEIAVAVVLFVPEKNAIKPNSC